MMKYEMWIDGSTKNNGQETTYGGWGFYMEYDGVNIFSANGGSYDTTNQRMELTAAIEAIKYFKQFTKNKEAKIIIYTDSAYLFNCWKEKWYKKWEGNKWLNSKQQPVANRDLWEKLIPSFKDKTIQFVKVKGHADNKGNIEADRLATEAAARVEAFENESNSY